MWYHHIDSVLNLLLLVTNVRQLTILRKMCSSAKMAGICSIPNKKLEEFKFFTSQWGIEHCTTSPHYLKSNGFTEKLLEKM